MKTISIKFFRHIVFTFVFAVSMYGQPNVLENVDYKKVASFMNEQLECERYVFSKGRFPQFWWRNESAVENTIGKVPLQVSYYNFKGELVNRAEFPGRYGAVISGKTTYGFTVRRYITLFCTDVDFEDYSKNVPIHLNNLKGYGIQKEIWDRYNANEERFSFGSLKYFPQRDPDAAVLLSGLFEMEPSAPWYDSPRIKDRQWWITMKSRLNEKLVLKNPLEVPKINSKYSSLSLIDSPSGSLEYDAVQFEKIKTACRTWSEQNGISQVTLIVHKGKIIFHEAFGKDDNGRPISVNERMWMASITKLLTGLLMMQFVDQGIIDLNASVGKYLPELSGRGNDKLTIRQLMNHTSGLHNSGEWASDWNASLENQIAQILPSINVGETFSYHRSGYALAGKVLERLTGRAVPYLFQENIFLPLGMSSAYADNTYGGLYCSAIDLAQFAQMLMNKGSYNGYTFISAETFSSMLPIQLSQGGRKWGVGTSSMGGNGLTDQTFGHAAASGSILRIDPKNELIIISARNNEGKGHRDFEKSLIENCAALIKNH